jgi:hypothetical protein
MNWLSNKSRESVGNLLVNTHKNDGPSDFIENLFALEMMYQGLPVYKSTTILHNVRLDNKEFSDLINKNGKGIFDLINNDYGSVSQVFDLNGTGVLILEDNLNYDPSVDDDVRTGNISVYLSSINKEFLQGFMKELMKFDKPSTSNGGKVYVMTGGRNLSITNIGKGGTEFVPENYNEEVVESFNYIVSELNKDDPNGRIVLMDGKPGSGKTYLTRSLINKVAKATFLIVPSNMVDNLGSPDFMDLFLRNRESLLSPIILIIEDADRCLQPRDDGNVSTISTMLNMTDGIVGHLLNIKVVATTNVSLEGIDSAIRRPGRLLKHTHVGPLTPERAMKVYQRLTGKSKNFSQPTTLAEVYYESKAATVKLSDLNETKKAMGFVK